MIILEVITGATKFIDDDGNYWVSLDDIAEIFPLELGPTLAPEYFDTFDIPF